MVGVSSPAKIRPWSELTAKMVMGVDPGLATLRAFPGSFQNFPSGKSQPHWVCGGVAHCWSHGAMRPKNITCPTNVYPNYFKLPQGALKGTNLRGQTEPFFRLLLIFCRSGVLENKAFGKCRFSQKTADFRKNPQKPQIGVCPLRFIPLSAARLPLPNLSFVESIFKVAQYLLTPCRIFEVF